MYDDYSQPNRLLYHSPQPCECRGVLCATYYGIHLFAVVPSQHRLCASFRSSSSQALHHAPPSSSSKGSFIQTILYSSHTNGTKVRGLVLTFPCPFSDPFR